MLAVTVIRRAVVGRTGVVVVAAGRARVAFATLAKITDGANDTVVADTTEVRVDTTPFGVAGVGGAGVAVVARVVNRCDAFGVLALGHPIFCAGIAVVAIIAFRIFVEGAHALTRSAFVCGAVVVVVAFLLVSVPGRVTLKATSLVLVTRLPTDRPGRTLGVVHLVGAAELFVTDVGSAIDAVVAVLGFVDALAAQASVDRACVEVFAQWRANQIIGLALHDGRRGQLATAHAKEAYVVAGARVAVVADHVVVGVGATFG